MKHRRTLSVLLTMVMVLSMFAGIPFTASAEAATVTVTDWNGLQAAVNKASKGQTIRLGKDIACAKNGGDPATSRTTTATSSRSRASPS